MGSRVCEIVLANGDLPILFGAWIESRLLGGDRTGSGERRSPGDISLMIQQPALAFDSRRKTRQASIGAHDAMTRNQDGDPRRSSY